nr:carbohydrate porin [Novosphingobium sp. 9]
MKQAISVAALVAATLVASPALAQEQQQTPESDATAAAGEAAVQSGDANAGGHLLGDWGGVRTDLSDKGIDISAGYLSETGSVVSGGLKHGTAYADQLKLQADIDLQKLVNLRGWSIHGQLVSRHGVSASAKYLGDDLGAVQEIYGATGNADIHLGHLYLEHIASGGGFTLDEKIGRIPVGEDFNTSPLYCGFLSLGICPQPRGQSIDQSYSLNPSATWGGRIKAATANWYVQAGAYQIRPRYGGPDGFDWGWSHTIGTEIPIEAGWTPRFGPMRFRATTSWAEPTIPATVPTCAPDTAIMTIRSRSMPASTRCWCGRARTARTD